jgi:hypothetical protein
VATPAAGNGDNLTIRSASGAGALDNAGTMGVDSGVGAVALVNLGTANSTLVTISQTGRQTTIAGLVDLGTAGTDYVSFIGYVDTDMTRALPEGQRAKLLERIPLGRLGAPEDIAHAVVFLASPHAGYITGATLHVNGGMYMA